MLPLEDFDLSRLTPCHIGALVELCDLKSHMMLDQISNKPNISSDDIVKSLNIFLSLMKDAAELLSGDEWHAEKALKELYMLNDDNVYGEIN